MKYATLHTTDEWKYNVVIILLVLEVSAKNTIDTIAFLYICHHGGSVRTWYIYL